VVGILATFLVLHIRELDAGRNIFWRRYKDSLGFWIHPLKPQTLIEEATASSNALLSTFHYTMGRKPLDMDWDQQKSQSMVKNDHKVIKSMKILQSYVSNLEETSKIGRMACDIYNGNPNNVAFTVSSLLFITNGYEVNGLF